MRKQTFVLREMGVVAEAEQSAMHPVEDLPIGGNQELDSIHDMEELILNQCSNSPSSKSHCINPTEWHAMEWLGWS